MNEYDVVVFNENHRWCGSLGYIKEIKGQRIMIGVPVPHKGTAYVFCKENDIEKIGRYPFREVEDND